MGKVIRYMGTDIEVEKLYSMEYVLDKLSKPVFFQTLWLQLTQSMRKHLA